MQLKPSLRVFDLAMIVVSLIIGVGIFKTPSLIAAKAGNENVFMLSWILGGVIAFLGGLTFAEIGSRLPAAGGFYKIFSVAFHPAFAFMLNWTTIITNSASAAGVGLIGAAYINSVLLPANLQTNAAQKFTTVIIIAMLYSLNLINA